MKQLAYLAFSLLLFTACDDFENTAEPSDVTYLPKMELQGNAFVQVPCGDSYTDAGVEVTEGGAPIDFETVVSGSYFGGTEVAGADAYVVAYSAVNKDGIPGSAFRDVVVEPCNDGTPEDISGLYESHVVRLTNGETHTVKNIYITRTGDNTFAISDLTGGFYDLGKGYGSDYSCKGAIITVNDIGTNDFSVTTATYPVWGNTIDVEEMTVSGNTISMLVQADFASGRWDYTLTRQ